MHIRYVLTFDVLGLFAAACFILLGWLLFPGTLLVILAAFGLLPFLFFCVMFAWLIEEYIDDR